jgi:hypothetical protein
MDSTAESREIKSIELDWYAEDDTVVVTPRDLVRFEIQKDRAIRALQLEAARDEFTAQFRLLLRVLAEWVDAQSTEVESAILTLQDGNLLFLVVQSGTEHDESLEDAVSELDFTVANDSDLHLVDMDVMCVPRVSSEALRSFIDERMVLSYGHRDRSRAPGQPQSRDARLPDAGG